MIPYSSFVFPELFALPDSKIKIKMGKVAIFQSSFISILCQLISTTHTSLLDESARTALQTSVRQIWDQATIPIDINTIRQRHGNLITHSQQVIPYFLSLILAAREHDLRTNIYSDAQSKVDIATEAAQLQYFQAIQQRIHFMISITEILFQVLCEQTMRSELHYFLVSIVSDISNIRINISNGLFYDYFSLEHYKKFIALCDHPKEAHFTEVMLNQLLPAESIDSRQICALDMLRYNLSLIPYQLQYHYALGEDEEANHILKTPQQSWLPAPQMQATVSWITHTVEALFKPYTHNIARSVEQNETRSIYRSLHSFFHNGTIQVQAKDPHQTFSEIVAGLNECIKNVSPATQMKLINGILTLDTAYREAYFQRKDVIEYCLCIISALTKIMDNEPPGTLVFEIKEKLALHKQKIEAAGDLIPPLNIGLSIEKSTTRLNPLRDGIPPIAIFLFSEFLDLDALLIHKENYVAIPPNTQPYKDCKIIFSSLTVCQSSSFFASFIYYNKVYLAVYNTLEKDLSEKVNPVLNTIWETNSPNAQLLSLTHELYDTLYLHSIVNSIIGARSQSISKNNHLFLNKENWLDYFENIKRTFNFMTHIGLALEEFLFKKTSAETAFLYYTSMLNDITCIVYNISNSLFYDMLTHDQEMLCVLCQNALEQGLSFIHTLLEFSKKYDADDLNVMNLLNFLMSWHLYEAKYYFAIGEDSKAMHALNNPSPQFLGRRCTLTEPLFEVHAHNKKVLETELTKNQARTRYSQLLACLDSKSSFYSLSMQQPEEIVTQFTSEMTNAAQFKIIQQSFVSLRTNSDMNYHNNNPGILSSCRSIVLKLIAPQNPTNIIARKIQKKLEDYLSDITRRQTLCEQECKFAAPAPVPSTTDTVTYTQIPIQDAPSPETLQNRLAQLKEKNMILKAERDKARTHKQKEIDATREAIEKLTKRKAYLLKTQAEKQGTLQTVGHKIQQIAQQIRELESTVAQNKTALQNLSLPLEALYADIARMKQNNAPLQEQAQAQQHVHDEQLKKIEGYKTTIAELTKQQQEYQKRQSNISKKTAALQAELSTIQKTQAEIKTQSSTIKSHNENKIKELQAQLSQQQSIHAELEAQNQELLSDLSYIHQTLQATNMHINIVNTGNSAIEQDWQNKLQGFYAVCCTLQQHLAAKQSQFLISYQTAITPAYSGQPVSGITQNTAPSPSGPTFTRVASFSNS